MSKRCFVIAPIGDKDSEVRKRSDGVLKHIIVKACDQCGYEKPIRADQIDEPGIITNQVIQHIINDELVIADLTGHNPNVFYELAVRHATQKPFVQLIRKGEKIPFDIGPMRTVFFDLHDPDSVEEAREEVIKQIKTIEEKSSPIDTPISAAIDLDRLQKSNLPMDEYFAKFIQGFAGVHSQIGELRVDVLEIFRRLSSVIDMLSRAGIAFPPSTPTLADFEGAQNMSEKEEAGAAVASAVVSALGPKVHVGKKLRQR